jgi:hypothetical protein
MSAQVIWNQLFVENTENGSVQGAQLKGIADLRVRVFLSLRIRISLSLKVS